MCLPKSNRYTQVKNLDRHDIWSDDLFILVYLCRQNRICALKIIISILKRISMNTVPKKRKIEFVGASILEKPIVRLNKN